MLLEHFRFLVPGWRDAFEIVLVAVVLYRLLRLLAGTRALQIVFGLLVLLGVYVGAFLLKLTMITYLLGVVFTYGTFAAIVVFQPELRNALARLGQSRLLRAITGVGTSSAPGEVADAVDRLSRNATGAIIVMERETGLDEYVNTGSIMQAAVSADLLTTIFTPYSPLHDGAVLIRGDQIVGAGCILPLTQYPVTDKSLGTRHRAALGLSEETDAAVIVVSEESAIISLALEGRLYRGLTPDQVREYLEGTWHPGPESFPAPAPSSS